jgi:hypothetical protein
MKETKEWRVQFYRGKRKKVKSEEEEGYWAPPWARSIIKTLSENLWQGCYVEDNNDRFESSKKYTMMMGTWEKV